MECVHNDALSTVEFLRQFNNRVSAQRIPMSGGIALTHACNVGCVHCYVGGKARYYAGRNELSTERILELLDEVTQAGCLYMLLTGGEAMLHKDFAQIYEHACLNGLLVTVFTNATMVTDEILELFQRYPPSNVDISVYGATQETYERITRVPGSFERCMSGIRRLSESGVNISLKTVVMTLNSHEYYQIEEIANDYGARFRSDAALFPRFNGDPSPLKYRIPPEQAVEFEFSDRQRALRWKKYADERQNLPITDKLYTCGSGQNTFHIDPCGKLQPCLMSVHQTYDLNTGTFAEGWASFVDTVREKRIPQDKQDGCGSRCGCGSTNSEERRTQSSEHVLSGFCPAFNQLETGSDSDNSEYIAQLGQQRSAALDKLAATR